MRRQIDATPEPTGGFGCHRKFPGTSNSNRVRAFVSNRDFDGQPPLVLSLLTSTAFLPVSLLVEPLVMNLVALKRSAGLMHCGLKMVGLDCSCNDLT